MRTSCNIFFLYFILFPKRKNATETHTRIIYLITSVTYNRMSKDLFLNALCPLVRRDSSSAHSVFGETACQRSAVDKRFGIEKERKYVPMGRRTYRAVLSRLFIPGLPATGIDHYCKSGFN